MKTANIYDPGATENDYLFMFNGEPVSGTGPVPTGTIQITSNGQHDVSDYATADVNVPQGITPSGSTNITANGTYDVTQYASAVVNVPQGSIHGEITYYDKFTPQQTYTRSNPLTIQLTASTNCYILVRAVSYPTPDATEYKALFWGNSIYAYGQTYTVNVVGHQILRPNGTIGTDATQCTFDYSTGILSVGGNSGHYMPGDEYEVIQVVFND